MHELSITEVVMILYVFNYFEKIYDLNKKVEHDLFFGFVGITKDPYNLQLVSICLLILFRPWTQFKTDLCFSLLAI